MLSQSKENLLGGGGRESALQSQTSLQAPPEVNLTAIEKKFLLHAERGDCATVKRLLAEYDGRPELDINCVDPLNRSALIAAIENENIELMHILIDAKIKVKDALLHAIKEEYVEAVEILLEWEERNHVPGEPYSWEAVNRDASTFTNDITPLILAAHMNNYEILKILLDRGATLPMPHDVRCGCDECVVSSKTDSLRHSQARINAYRALTAPSLIALSSRDPLLTAFELSWQVRRLSRMENEFRDEYNEMRTRCQTFATSLLDHARTSHELEVMLNHNPDGETWEPGERQPLERLKLAIKYKQKRFVAHPSVQQLLAAIWYEGLPGFRRKGQVAQIFDVAKLGAMFPVYSSIYMMAPTSEMGLFMKKPFVKFICHSTSYAFFLMLLGLASQRVEFLLIEWFGTDWMRAILEEWKRKERGSLPGLVEFAVIVYVISLIWSEVRSLWSDGLMEYVSDLWNIVDFITNCFYMMWICLRFTSVFVVKRESWNGLDPWYPREKWDQFDPMLLSEGAFAAGMIFSFLKLVHIFSVNPHLGPLQISLGRMIIDILKFFFIYSLVLFAFGCGMNQLMWYYADLERAKCYHTPDGLADFDNEDKACSIWRRFSNLFETSQSLFWASFGMVDLMTFELTGIKSFTRFWALLLFGSYSVINIIVLLNMLIAMMSNSYQIISERSDTEWKFARSHLWMSYFEDGDTVPPPFNLIPTSKGISIIFGCVAGSRSKGSTIRKKNREKAQERHDTVMHLLVRRYVTAEQRKRDDVGITEDDVMEIRQDISTLRFELIDILRNNGMNCPNMDKSDTNVPGKKGRVMERRLLKDFQIGFVEGVVNAAITDDKEPKDVFSKIARAIGRRTSSQRQKKDWNAMVRRSTMQRDPIGSTSEFVTRQSLRRHIIDNMGTALESMDPEKLIEYNPKLSLVSPAARVAYAKFKMRKIQQEYQEKEDNPALVEEGEAEREAEHDEKQRASTTTTTPKEGADADAGAAEVVTSPTPAATLPEVTTLDETSSIVRPRPRSSIRSIHSEISATVGSDFRSRTPIPEEPRDESRAATPAMEVEKPKEVEEPVVEKVEASKAEASKTEDKEDAPKDEAKEKKPEEAKKEEKPASSPAPKPAFAPSSKRGPWL